MKKEGATTPRPRNAKKIETQILENLIELQKVNINVAEKFDKLSNQISELLNLFEVTARNFSKQSPAPMGEKDKEFLEKINTLLEQNKTIAKGLTLMEMKMREKIYGPVSSSPQQGPQVNPRPQWQP